MKCDIAICEISLQAVNAAQAFERGNKNLVESARFLAEFNCLLVRVFGVSELPVPACLIPACINSCSFAESLAEACTDLTRLDRSATSVNFPAAVNALTCSSKRS